MMTRPPPPLPCRYSITIFLFERTYYYYVDNQRLCSGGSVAWRVQNFFGLSLNQKKLHYTALWRKLLPKMGKKKERKKIGICDGSILWRTARASHWLAGWGTHQRG
jgi:hypothetical protein